MKCWKCRRRISPEEGEKQRFEAAVTELHQEESGRSFFIDDVAKRLIVRVSVGDDSLSWHPEDAKFTHLTDACYEIAQAMWTARERFVDADCERREASVAALRKKYGLGKEKVDE